MYMGGAYRIGSKILVLFSFIEKYSIGLLLLMVRNGFDNIFGNNCDIGSCVFNVIWTKLFTTRAFTSDCSVQ